MAEVAHVGEEHRNTVLVGGGNHFVITKIEPPGWITQVTPAAAASIPSRNGKNASEATEEPFASGGLHRRFNTGDFCGVHAAHLARANADSHIVLA